MTKIGEFWWHNAIDGNRDAQSIKVDAEYCLDVAKMLDEAVNSKAIVLTGGDSQPSLTRWDVLNEGVYKEVCIKHELEPGDFEFEFEDDEGD